VWTQAAVQLDTWRRAYGLDDHRPAKHGWEEARSQRTPPPIDRLRSTVADPGRPAAGERPATKRERGTPTQQPRHAPRWRHATHERGEATAAELLGAEPSRQQPGRRRDWQQVRTALERLAAHRDRDPDHHRDGRLDDRHGTERAPAARERDSR
jgi:hypothetical protein